MAYPGTRAWLLILIVFALAGCAPSAPIQPPAPAPAALRPFMVGDVIDTATGRIISFDGLIGELSRARAIYAGETHTSMEDHRAQLRILEALHAKNPHLVLGMEMFPRAVQPVLDRYSDGSLSTDDFLQESGWDMIWGFPFHLYKGLLTYARDQHLKILGLNAPGAVVKKIGHEGLAALTPVERAQVARDFHLDDAANRRRIESEYRIHAKQGIKDFEGFFEAQLAWEETMAETIADYMAGLDPSWQIVVIVGKGHMSGGHGIPELVHGRIPLPFKTVAPIPIDYPGAAGDPDIADYVIITDRAEAAHRPRLGVMVKPAASGHGLEVNGVLQNSPAADATIQKGDVILTVDGAPVNTVEDLQEVISKKGPVLQIVIERAGRRIQVKVTTER
jgi:uncharacterized iron-regulated protein